MGDLASDPRPLTAVMRAALGTAGGEPSNLQRLSAGASSEIWSYDFGDDPPAGYVLRIAAPGANRVAVSTEAAAMRAAAEAGVPVPGIVCASDDTEAFGRPYMVMDRVEGETIARHVLRDDGFEEARKLFASQCGRILGRLRRVAPGSVPGLKADGDLARWEELLRKMGVQVPTFEWALRYLASSQPESTVTALVHGDFRLGNLIIGHEGVRAVLDWEITHEGDPLEDLGWLCSRPWRFRGPAPVGGMGEYEELLEAYEEESGVRVDREELRWWEVFATLRWGVICLMQAGRHLGGSDRSVELAAIGRRVVETELDLLDCLAPGSAGGALRPAPESTGFSDDYGLPTAAQLVEAVTEYLERDVADALTGRRRFHLRVALNVLNVVRRQLELSEADSPVRLAILSEFGVTSERELSEAIRAGRLDGDDRLPGALRTLVTARLRVNNPTYLETYS